MIGTGIGLKLGALLIAGAVSGYVGSNLVLADFAAAGTTPAQVQANVTQIVANARENYRIERCMAQPGSDVLACASTVGG